jgi:undecaprenyl-diphosphatase
MGMGRKVVEAGRRELGVLVALAVVAGALWLFAGLAAKVAEGEGWAYDRQLLLALRNPADPADPIGPRWLEEVARDVTALGGATVLVLATLAAAGFLAMAGKRRTAGFLLLAGGGGWVVSNLLKWGIDRARPDLVPHGAVVYTASFPSGHAMMAAATWLTLAALIARASPRRRVKALVLALAVAITLMVGVSRVYLGVHWPSDVAAGWALGAAWAILSWLVMRRLQRRGRVERPEEAEEERAADPDVRAG